MLDRVFQSGYAVIIEDSMLRQVMIPSKENSTISIPAEFYGTEVEILVFPSLNSKANKDSGSIKDLFAKHRYSFKNYKFNRDEANDYE
jgi:hypothetical protein